MLPDGQVEKFIEERLGICDWSEQLAKSKKDFLTTLYRRFRQIIYFENISMSAKSPEERRSPTVQDVIYQVTETPGGVCIHLNFFMKMILEHVGYNVYCVGGSVGSMTVPNNHIMLIVRIPNLGEQDCGEEYMVDVGFSWPIGGPINMKQLPHEYKAGGFKIRYEFNHERNVYQRVLIGGDPINKDFENENEEKIDMRFDLKPLQFVDYGDAMKAIFTDPESMFLSTTLLFRYVSFEDEINYKYVCCVGRQIVIGSATSREVHRYETYPEMIPYILKHFPDLDAEKVSKAMELYQTRHK